MEPVNTMYPAVNARPAGIQPTAQQLPAQLPAQQGMQPTAYQATSLPVQGVPTPAMPQPVFFLTQEDLIIRVFFSDGQLSSKMRPHLKSELFKDPDNKTIATIITMFEKKYDRVPTAQELITGMGQTLYAMKAREKLLRICNTPMQSFHMDYLTAMVESFFQERMAEQVLMNAAEAINEKNTDAIRDLIAPLREAVTFSLHLDLGLNIYEDIETALAMLRERKECIPTAINELRYYTGRKDATGTYHGGGYYRKTLTLYAGQPNIGKSLVLCSEAANAYVHGYNTLYISLELSEDYVWQRIASNICNCDLYSVISLNEADCRAMIDAKLTETGVEKRAAMNVKRMKSTTTPAEIESLVDSFEISHGKLDFLVIDYIGIMKPAKGRVSESNMYADGVAKAEQIRDMLIERNIAGLSAVQFNRTGYHSLDAGIESVEGSSGYAETCDVMISLTGDEVTRQCGMLFSWILKNRFGPNMVQFVTRCNFATMTWFSPTQDEIDKYNEARADADVQVNSDQGRNRKFGQGNGPRRAGSSSPQQKPKADQASEGNLTVKPDAPVASLNSTWDGV